MSPGGADRLEAAFAHARAEGRAALVGYLPAGLPSVDGGIRLLRAMVDGGVDVVEVGLPYSDPLMDGPVIQQAVDRALHAGVRTADVLRTVAAVAETGRPVLVMTYWNPVDRYGADRFAADLHAAGGSGVITPDLLPDEATEWLAALRARALAPVFLVAPSSTDTRLRLVQASNRGFVYAASTMGVTGARQELSGRAQDLVARTHAAGGLPVAVGLGIGTGAQAAEVAAFADGVIVGSAFVDRVLAAPDLDTAVEGVAGLAADLAAGVRHQVLGRTP